MKRFLPAVVPPYGIPLKMLTPSTTVPRTLPADVSTIALPASAALAILSNEPACAPASSQDACFTKPLRFDMPAILIHPSFHLRFNLDRRRVVELSLSDRGAARGLWISRSGHRQHLRQNPFDLKMGGARPSKSSRDDLPAHRYGTQ